MEKNSQTDAEINNFLYSIKDNDVRNFLLSICRIFNEKSLTRFFDLKALIELYNICTSYLKKEDTAF